MLEHEPHPDCPDTLNCLPNTEGRPQHTLPVILRCAILGSPRKRLTIREIYAAMEEKYPYYKTAGPTWKQSVRHHLSLNRLFERQPRPVTDPGFGSYWTVNLSAPPGTKRPRKRGCPSRNMHHEIGSQPGKRRGRPRKSLPDANLPQLPPIATLAQSAESVSRQCQFLFSRAASHAPEPEDNEDDPVSSSMGDGQSDRDFESEEDMHYPFRRPLSITARTPFAGHDFPGVITPLVPASFAMDATSGHLEMLQLEVDDLRRQVLDLQTTRTQLSSQLAEAKSEASRAWEAQRVAERKLKDERRRRTEAEELADEESRLRRVADHDRLRGYYQTSANKHP